MAVFLLYNCFKTLMFYDKIKVEVNDNENNHDESETEGAVKE